MHWELQAGLYRAAVQARPTWLREGRGGCEPAERAAAAAGGAAATGCTDGAAELAPGSACCWAALTCGIDRCVDSCAAWSAWHSSCCIIAQADQAGSFCHPLWGAVSLSMLRRSPGRGMAPEAALRRLAVPFAAVQGAEQRWLALKWAAARQLASLSWVQGPACWVWLTARTAAEQPAPAHPVRSSRTVAQALGRCNMSVRRLTAAAGVRSAQQPTWGA